MKKLLGLLFCTIAVVFADTDAIIKRSHDLVHADFVQLAPEYKDAIKKIMHDVQIDMSLDALDDCLSDTPVLSLYMMPHTQQNAAIKSAVMSRIYAVYGMSMLKELLQLYDKNHEALQYWKLYVFTKEHARFAWLRNKFFSSKNSQLAVQKNLTQLKKQEQELAHCIGTIRQALGALSEAQDGQALQAQLLMAVHIQLMMLQIDQACDEPSSLLFYTKLMVDSSLVWLKKQEHILEKVKAPSHLSRYKVGYILGSVALATTVYMALQYKKEISESIDVAYAQAKNLYQEHIKQPWLDFYDALTQKRQVDFQKFKTISDREIDKGLNFFRNNVSTTKSMIAASITDEGLQAVGYEKTEDPMVRAQQLQELCSINLPLDSDTAVAQFRKIETALKVSLPTRWGKHFKLDLDRRVDQALMDLRLEFIKFNMNFVAAGEEMIPVLMDRLKTTEHNINVALTEAKLLDEKLNLVIQVAALFPASLVGMGLFKGLRYGYYSLFKKHFTYGPIKDLLRELEDLLIVSINKLVDPQVEGRIYYLTEKIQSYQYELSQKDQMLLQDDMKTLQSTQLSFRQKLYVVQRMHTSYLFLQQGVA